MNPEGNTPNNQSQCHTDQPTPGRGESHEAAVSSQCLSALDALARLRDRARRDLRIAQGLFEEQEPRARIEALDAAMAALSAPKPESAEVVWTDEQCLQFAATAFRHAPKNLPDGVTLEDIRIAVRTVQGNTAPPRPEASGLAHATVQKVVGALSQLGIAAPEGHEEQAARADELVSELCDAVLLTAPQQASAPVGVEQIITTDEAGWALAKRAEVAGAERDSDDNGTWWTLRIEQFKALAQQPAAVDGAWRQKAAEWLEAQAVRQEANNQRWPEHAAAYKSWRDQPVVLRMLANRVLSAAQHQGDQA